MASKIKVTPQTQEVPEKGAPATPPDRPLLDLSDAAIKTLVRTARERGYITHDQINTRLKEINSEQIEDILAMFSGMGINVVEPEEASDDEERDEEPEEETERESAELVEVRRKVPTKSDVKEPIERTDDPVRMYLREMGSAELLSREGEIAIAKRIEAGREAMIAGLCESPLTFQAIIIWREHLKEGKIFLRDIIDLEATYAGPDAKNNMNPLLAAPLGPDGQPLAAANGNGEAMPAAAAPAHVAPPAAPPSPTPFRAAAPGATEGEGEEKDPAEAAAEGDMDDDEFENQMSLAAIEAEL